MALIIPPLVILSLFGMLMFAFGTPASAMSEEEKAAVKWPEQDDDSAPCGAEESMAGHTFID